ncbi:MAG TPA: hypothetical protein VGO92_14705 [Acidimicrobiales bacterium]|nr:hypothetical protein [Acidimicrobiales bacterium]
MADVVVVEATQDWSGWDRFDPWTVILPTTTGLAALSAAVLAGCLWATELEGRWSRWFVTLSVLGVFPGAYAAVWAEGRAGGSVVEFIALLVVSAGLGCIAASALVIVVRGVVGVMNRRRAARGQPALAESVRGWAHEHVPLQHVAVVMAGGSGLWLLGATFQLRHVTQKPGLLRTFLEAIVRLEQAGDALAIGLIAAAVTMWFQASPSMRAADSESSPAVPASLAVPEDRAPLPPPRSPAAKAASLALGAALAGAGAALAVMARTRAWPRQPRSP